MSTTITGQRLSELSTLTLGATGSAFYITSSSENSYKIYERDLYTTLNKFHISGDYQPKFEDWRFVHKTGNESITGIKNFVDDITINGSSLATLVDWRFVHTTGDQLITGLKTFYSGIKVHAAIGLNKVLDTSDYTLHPADNANASIDWDNGFLRDAWATSENVLDWKNSFLYLNDGATKTVDWQNRVLSGNWTIENFTNISGNSVSLANGFETGQVAGLGLSSAPKSVNLTVERPAVGLLLFAGLSGSPTTDGFKYQLNGATDSANYKLHYYITL